MTNLDAPGYQLREDLRVAAHASIARQRRVARRRRIVLAAVVTALLGGGAAAAAVLLGQATAPEPRLTVSTSASQAPPLHTSPSGADARGKMSVFSSAASGPQPPPAVTRALSTYARNPGQDFGAAVGAGRLLVNAGHAALYAVATDRGYVCFALTSDDSVAGSCAATLDQGAPISVIVGQEKAGASTVFAGVASDDAETVTAVGDHGQICQTTVTDNGFICKAPNARPGQIHSFLVRLRNGQVVTIPF